MKKFILFFTLSLCFSVIFSQNHQPVTRNRCENGPLKADVSADNFPAIESSVQQPCDSMVQYKFSSPLDSVYYMKRIYSYDDKSRREDELWLKWDIANHVWKNYVKFHYSYDDADRMTFEADYLFQEGKWIGIFREEQTFDENGKQVLYIFSQDWDTTLNEFIPLEKNETSYEGDNVSTFTSYTWMADVNGGNWVKSYHFESTYNEQGDFEVNISTRWSQESNSWENFSKDTATYNDQGLQTMIEHFFWESDGWLPNEKQIISYSDLTVSTFSYTYMKESGTWLPYIKTECLEDENNNVLYLIEYSYLSDNWVLSLKYDYTYDDHQNKTSQMIAGWNDDIDEWVMKTKWTKSFDGQDREVYFAQFEWDMTVSDWNEISRTEKEYNELGNLAVSINVNFKNAYGSRAIYNYDDMGNTLSYVQYSGDYDNWILSYKGYYYLTPQIPSGVSASEAGSLLVYPNPATEVICISGIHGAAFLTVYDLQGNQVLQTKVGSGQPVSLSGLSKGMYLAKIRTADGILERKIVKN
jgi:hypothetical protein